MSQLADVRVRSPSCSGRDGSRADQFAGSGAGPSVGLEQIFDCARRRVWMAAHDGLEMARNVDEAHPPGQKARDQFLVGGVEARGHRVSRCERFVRKTKTWKARKIRFLEREPRIFSER